MYNRQWGFTCVPKRRYVLKPEVLFQAEVSEILTANSKNNSDEIVLTLITKGMFLIHVGFAVFHKKQKQ